MSWQLIPHQGPPLVTVGIALGLAGYAIHHRERPGAVPLSLVFLSIAVWSLSYALQLGVTSLGAKSFWANVAILGIVTLPAAWLLFALSFTGLQEWVTRRTVAVLSVEPLAVLALVSTNDAHHLVIRSVGLETMLGYQVLSVSFGPAFRVHAVYSYGVVLVGTALVARTVYLTDDCYRDQGVAVILAALIPLVGNLASVVFHLFPIDVTASSFLATGIVASWAVFRHRLLRVIPLTREVGRDALVEGLDAAVLVVGSGGRIADCNPAGADLIGERRADLLGARFSTTVPELADVVDLADEGTRATVELGTTGRIRTYDVHTRPLELADGFGVGHLVRFRDVTDREQREQRLEVLNRLLRHNIRNDMTLIDGNAGLIGDVSDSQVVTERAEAISTTAETLTDRAEKLRRVTQELERDKELPVDLAASIVYKTEQVRARHPRATLDVSAPDSAPVAAGSAVDLAIEELLTNAVEHSGGACPRVDVTVERDDRVVRLRVADDGPGLPDHERQVIEAGTESPLEHGSGIGLWLASWIVETFGGTIRFADNDPTGTVVTVELPRANSIRDDTDAVSATGRI